MSLGRVVVTGATGLVGRPLVTALLREGYTVTALVRHPEVARGKLPDGVELSAWRGDAPPDAEVFADGAGQDGQGGQDGQNRAPLAGVVHLAGESIGKWPWSQARKELLWHSRVTATRHLVQAMREATVPPPVLVTASGMGYHGDAGILPVTEEGAPGRGFLGELATAWEAAAQAAEASQEAKSNSATETRVVMLRFGMILAREGGALPALRRPFALGLGARLGSGRQGHPWIHLDDAVGLILHALRAGKGEQGGEQARAGGASQAIGAAFRPLSGPVHACVTPVPSQAEFARALGRALHRPVWAWAPGFALRAALGDFANLLLDGQYSASVKPSQAGYSWHYPDLDSALQAIVSPS